MENSKEENREYIKEYWDFESTAIENLKEFLQNNLNQKGEKNESKK